jgi:hypothetical protein
VQHLLLLSRVPHPMEIDRSRRIGSDNGGIFVQSSSLASTVYLSSFSYERKWRMILHKVLPYASKGKGSALRTQG